MSIATDFRAALTSHAALTALVPAASISLNVAAPEQDLPVVIFSVQTDETVGLSGSELGTRAEVTVQCWAESAEDASDIATQVRAALVANAINSAIVVAESDAYDPDLKCHAQTLSVVWMV